MNTAEIKNYREQLNLHLKLLANQLGVQITLGKAKYSDTNVTFQLELAEINNGVPQTTTINEFNNHCHNYGLKPTDLGKKFVYQGKQYELSGIKPTSYKFPLLGKRYDGKTFKFTISIVSLLKDQTHG